MKKNLLLSVAIFIFCNTFSQTQAPYIIKVNKTDRLDELNVMRRLAARDNAIKMQNNQALLSQNSSVAERPAASNSVVWQPLCGSMNVYGMLLSSQKPLQYNPAINAISFIHRKSDFYQPSPSVPLDAESGVVLAEITSNWGGSWDSTCIWSNTSDWGRYPQGAIYNPPANTNISNAYVVGCGVTVDASGFSGNWYTSKKLNTFNNIADPQTGAQQFFSNNLAAPNNYPPNMPRHAWSYNGFTATDDGVLRSLATLGTDLQNNITTRGYAVVTGTFNGATFDWQLDSIMPDALLKADGSKHLMDGQMAWNQAGTIGYVVGIGVMNTASLSNRAYQPIIYKLDKTLSSNATWTLMPGLDFNSQFKDLTTSLAQRPVTFPATTGNAVALPFTSEFDIAVDANNQLHLGVVFMSGFSDHIDSLTYYSTFETSINPTENYKWPHVPGARPYIYDFVGDGTQPWEVLTIDSISSETPGFILGQSGYGENPWDADPDNGDKIPMDARLQLGRTPDGKIITVSWAESDTAYTFNQFKYNALPDIKIRSVFVADNYCNYTINNGPKLNLTIDNLNIRTRASLHYMSRTCSGATITPLLNSYPNQNFTAKLNVPFTITNSNPYSQFTNNGTWFGNAAVTHTFSTLSRCVGIQNHVLEQRDFLIFPNPASKEVFIKHHFVAEAEISIYIKNSLGQLVWNESSNSDKALNDLKIDVSGLDAGIYIIVLETRKGSVAKKLVVE